MVTTDADLELQGAEGFDADDEVTDELDDATEPPVEDEADPVAALQEEVRSLKDELAGLRHLRSLDPNKINPALGRIAALQSQFDESRKSNPLESVDPRLAANEEVLTGLADALIASDLIDDASKSSLRNARAKLDQATTERAQARLRRELLEEVRGAQAPQAQNDDENPWMQATQDVVEEAQRLGYDAAKIPAEVWSAARATGRPALAVRNVLKWVEDQLESDDTPTTRVAARKRAAGNGSPPRSGAAMSNDDIIERYGQGDPSITAEQYAKAAKAEGLI